MLLYWSVLQLALRKVTVSSISRSTPGEGHTSSRSNKAKPFQLYWHYWMQNGKPMPELNPKNPRYQPRSRHGKVVALTRVIGPVIVKTYLEG
jgi:hypothetical protein